MALAQDASPSNHPSRHPATSSSVVTTSILQTTRLADGKKMINQYVMDAKVGSGQHGHVWRCYENKYYLALDERRVLAMKIVKRDNPKARRDRQYKMLRMRANNNSNGSGSGSGGGGLGGNRPRSNPTVVDGIRTAEQEIRKEIAIMKKCRHPHVVRLYEVIDDRKNEMVFMVMEYLGGGEIQYTSPSNPGKPILTVEQTRRIMRDAILGLEYLHHQGIIHRDIKPANLLWSTGHERVKIADFGTAHFSYAQRLAAAKTSNLQMADNTEEDPLLLNDADLAKRAGSPAFLAPEIVWEFTEWEEARLFYPSWWALSETTPPRPPVTKSIDIWALGVTLYCLLFGKIPFCPPPERGSSVDVTANDHSNGEQPDGGQSSNANVNVTEWVMYRYICNKDWRAERRMGRDGVFTGGRDAGDQMTREMEEEEKEEPGAEGEEEERVQGRTEAKTIENGSREGSLVMHLLDHFLQKDLNTRITLEEVKMNPWFLHDLPNPDFWLRMTSPNEIDSGSGVAESMTTTTVNVDVNMNSASSLSSSTSPVTTSGSSILGVSTASTTTTATSPVEANVLVTSSSSSAVGIEIGTDGDIFSGSYTFSQTTTNPSTNTQTHTHTHVIVPAATASTSAPTSHPTSDEDGLGALTKIEVTEKEREDAMSVLKFRWRVGGDSGGAGGNGGSAGAKGQGKGSFSRISSRITSFFRGGNTDKSKTRAKSGRETKKNELGLRDRGPVTSEPNLRLKAIRAERVERVPRERKRSGRDGREGRDKSKAKRKLEKAVTETAGSSYLATGSRESKEQTRSARPTMFSAPEKEKRGRDLDRDVDESDERTPRMGGTRQLQSVSLPSATPRFSSAGASKSASMTQAQTRRREDKGKGKQKAGDVDVDVDPSHPSSSPRSPARFLSRSISRSRSARRSRSRNSTSGTATVKAVGRGSVTTPTTISTVSTAAAMTTTTTTTNHPSPTMSPMGRIFSSLSSGWKRSESVVSLGLGLHNRSFSSISGIRQAATATGGEGTTVMTSQSAPGSGAGSPSSAPSATSSMLYLRQDVVTRSSPPTPIESSTSSPTSPLSPTARRPRPVHAITQPLSPIGGRTHTHSRSQSQSKFFVHTSDEDDLGDEFQSDDDDDLSSSILSDEILHYRRTSSWDQEHRGGHHPPELESLHPEPEPFLSPVSPISFSRGTRNEYEYDADVHYDYEDDEDDEDGLNLDEDPGVNPGTVSRASVPRTPRRRGWDALSDGYVEDVDDMSNLDMSDAEEGEGGGRRRGEEGAEDEGLVISFGKRKTEGKSSP